MGINMKKMFKRLPGKDTKQTLLGLGPINMATGGAAGAHLATAMGNTKSGRQMIVEDKDLDRYAAPMVGVGPGGAKAQHEMRMMREEEDEKRLQTNIATEIDVATKAAAQQALVEQQEEYLKQRRRKGYSSTVLTGFDKGSAPVYRKTLLGG